MQVELVFGRMKMVSNHSPTQFSTDRKQKQIMLILSILCWHMLNILWWLRLGKGWTRGGDCEFFHGQGFWWKFVGKTCIRIHGEVSAYSCAKAIPVQSRQPFPRKVAWAMASNAFKHHPLLGFFKHVYVCRWSFLSYWFHFPRSLTSIKDSCLRAGQLDGSKREDQCKRQSHERTWSKAWLYLGISDEEDAHSNFSWRLPSNGSAQELGNMFVERAKMLWKTRTARSIVSCSVSDVVFNSLSSWTFFASHSKSLTFSDTTFQYTDPPT